MIIPTVTIKLDGAGNELRAEERGPKIRFVYTNVHGQSVAFDMEPDDARDLSNWILTDEAPP